MVPTPFSVRRITISLELDSSFGFVLLIDLIVHARLWRIVVTDVYTWQLLFLLLDYTSHGE